MYITWSAEDTESSALYHFTNAILLTVLCLLTADQHQIFPDNILTFFVSRTQNPIEERNVNHFSEWMMKK